MRGAASHTLVADLERFIAAAYRETRAERFAGWRADTSIPAPV